MTTREAPLDRIDSVYMLMFPGWKGELRSNRWHYARRWARHVPVVMIQSDQESDRRGVVSVEERIPNCEILSVRSLGEPDSYWQDAMRPVGQIAHHMERRGHRRPLFWSYNPYLLAVYASLPAVFRVHHASENYFDFEARALPEFFYDLLKKALELSDRVIAVSSGVAKSIQEEVPRATVVEVSNGCDYEEYSRYVPSERLKKERGHFAQIAIYAGNINARLDFELLTKCVARAPETLFAFFGPVLSLASEDEPIWQRLLAAPNLKYFGAAEPAELPHLYGAADLGLIPYKRTPLLERNGFPLKALEMTATELPVISTYMKPLEEVEDVLTLARDHESFLLGLSARSRSQLSEDQRRRMRETCRARDYDQRFSQVLTAIAEVPTRTVAQTKLDSILGLATVEHALWAISRVSEPCSVTLRRCAKSFLRSILIRTLRIVVPTWVRKWIPPSVRSLFRGYI